jgi:hypothetical protein
VWGLRDLLSNLEDVGLNPVGAKFVLQYMEWLIIRVDYRTPTEDHFTMWVVYEEYKKLQQRLL